MKYRQGKFGNWFLTKCLFICGVSTKKRKTSYHWRSSFTTIKPGNLYKGLEAIFLDVVDFFLLSISVNRP